MSAGLIAGAIATVLMSLAFLEARWLGLVWTAPPAQIAENTASEAGLGGPATQSFSPVWLGPNVIFGAGRELGYAALEPKPPKPLVAGGIGRGS